MRVSPKPSPQQVGLHTASSTERGRGVHPGRRAPRRFEFERDTFRFANELI